MEERLKIILIGFEPWSKDYPWRKKKDYDNCSGLCFLHPQALSEKHKTFSKGFPLTVKFHFGPLRIHLVLGSDESTCTKTRPSFIISDYSLDT